MIEIHTLLPAYDSRMITEEGRSGTIESSFDIEGNPDWYVELYVNGQLVRNGAFSTERGALRVVQNHLKAGR